MATTKHVPLTMTRLVLCLMINARIPLVRFLSRYESM